jgi:hypothetical protein
MAIRWHDSLGEWIRSIDCDLRREHRTLQRSRQTEYRALSRGFHAPPLCCQVCSFDIANRDIKASSRRPSQTALGRSRSLQLPRITTLWCLGALPLCSLAGPGGSESRDAPPHQLPRVIFECEAGAGATSSTCSAWIWQGGSYSAVWSIGAVGQLTVSGARDGEITFQRTDTAGLLAGLRGTYTGRFDGARFDDGKATFSLTGASNTGAWTGVAEVTPVVHTHLGMVQTVTQDEIYGVGRQPPAPYYNYYTADLTGYAIYTERWVGSGLKGTVIEDFRAVGEAPMKPGDRRSVDLRSPRIAADYEPGAAYRPGMAIAAIYSDGASFGDSKVLAAMIERRDAAYDYVGKNLHPRGRLTDGQKIKRSWDLLDKLRTGLADPVKDGSGQAAIPAVTALACSLP